MLFYGADMLKIKMKRRAAEAARAATQIGEIRASIIALNDDDLLDLADIFSGKIHAFLGEVASAELKRRNLSLEAHFAD
jgi:hypothetical protein